MVEDFWMLCSLFKVELLLNCVEELSNTQKAKGSSWNKLSMFSTGLTESFILLHLVQQLPAHNEGSTMIDALINEGGT